MSLMGVPNHIPACPLILFFKAHDPIEEKKEKIFLFNTMLLEQFL